MQHVEELGHSNWLPGHWTAPKGLVSVERMTQDSTSPVSEGHCLHPSRSCRQQGLHSQLQGFGGAGTRARALFNKSSPR